MGNFLTSEFQNPPSLSSFSPAPPHQDPKTYEKKQYGAFEQQRFKQDTHPNAEIEGNPTKDIKRCALQKIIYTNQCFIHDAAVESSTCRTNSNLHSVSLVST